MLKEKTKQMESKHPDLPSQLIARLKSLPLLDPSWTKIGKFCNKVDVPYTVAALQRLLSLCRNDVEFLATLRNHSQKVAPQEARSLARIRDIRPELDRLLADKQINTNQLNYLDVGCAEGQITEAVADYLKLKADRAFGVDVEGAHSSSAKTKPSAVGYTLKLYNGRDLEFKSEQFDLMTAFMAAHHFENPDETIASMRRVMKRQGLLIVREHDVAEGDWQMGIFLDFVHAVYMSVVGSEATPLQFAHLYSKSTAFARYRSSDYWIKVFAKYGFVLQEKRQTNDLFASCYMIFKVVV